MAAISETETIIKKIIPYLERLGYKIDKDITFEDPVLIGAANRKGFIDILVHCEKTNPVFLIEAKRDGVRIVEKHRAQALEYAKNAGCLFCVITNGKTFELLNTRTKNVILLNKKSNKLPRKTDLSEALKQLRKDPECNNLQLGDDKKLPYREGLSLSKMNQLIQSCHNIIRRIEKNEESAFADFSKFLFLKLLEEKWDQNNENPPYTYTFYELAETRDSEADRVKDAIISMLNKITTIKDYGEVINSGINLKHDITYLRIVKILSKVSFSDCDLDSKGAAFEYFVRATLKGKKLGQYFTPRPLVKLMLRLANAEQIVTSLEYGKPFKVLDPACGTGGFLVTGLNMSLTLIEKEYTAGRISKDEYNEIEEKIKKEVFFGIDANEGVASSAKMNMIIAGDGHSNIKCLDSLKVNKFIPDYSYKERIIGDGLADIILSNPPFGTVEGESLGKDINNYEIKATKGQHLFLQKMISSVKSNGRIVTVIDEGVLNTESCTALRKHILRQCKINMIISLPDETFKPNKINVKSSVLVMTKREHPDENLTEEYMIPCVKIECLGYDSSGETIKGFNEEKLISDIKNIDANKLEKGKIYKESQHEFFTIDSIDIVNDRANRFDLRYWNPDTIKFIQLKTSTIIKNINLIETSRGKSPSAADYVSKNDGYALVAKAGSNINKSGEFVPDGDFIEESTFTENKNKYFILKDGDVLIASTGEGTLGKCCVYRTIKDADGNEIPVIADGHITIVRVNQKKIYPEFICDYLRVGLGAKQIERLYTGSTGLIELTPVDIDRIVLPDNYDLQGQKKISNDLRRKEKNLKLKMIKLTEERNDIINEFSNIFIN